jgi:FMN phosphatase YigB (HAD superfamily)
LPICGQTITEIAFGRRGPVKLVFGDRYDTEILIMDAITLRRGQSERALMVGDSVRSDVEGARAFGMRAIHLARDSAAARPGSVRSLTELAELIKRNAG